MTYPEKNATYKHTPAFIERMKAGENEKPTPFRADGGPVAPAIGLIHSAADWASKGMADRMKQDDTGVTLNRSHIDSGPGGPSSHSGDDSPPSPNPNQDNMNR